MGQQRFEVAMFSDQLGRGLDADAGHARHIVDESPASACTSTTLRAARRTSRSPRLRRCVLFFIGVDHGDAASTSCIRSLSDETITTSPPASAAARIGGDQVVGLEALQLEAGTLKARAASRISGNCGIRLRRRSGRWALYSAVDGVAEGLLALWSKITARWVGSSSPLVSAEASTACCRSRDRADRQAVGLARQRRQGVEGAEDIARAVDEIDAAAGRDGGRRASWAACW